MSFLELWQEPGAPSQVIMGMALQHSCLFSYVRTPDYLRGTSQDSP